MEKQTPHCKLSIVKALAAAGKVRTTHAARTGANALGLHTIWQDVYRPTTHAGVVHLKLTVIEDVLIASFKEL